MVASMHQELKANYTQLKANYTTQDRAIIKLEEQVRRLKSRLELANRPGPASTTSPQSEGNGRSPPSSALAQTIATLKRELAQEEREHQHLMNTQQTQNPTMRSLPQKLEVHTISKEIGTLGKRGAEGLWVR